MDYYDVVVLGAGPAGLQAAIHAARKKAKVVVFGRIHKSSAYRAHVDNFCCLSRIDGADLLSEGRKQAEKHGAQFFEEDVLKITKEDPWFLVETESGNTFQAGAIVLAMGISRHKLRVPGEKEFIGRGVSYCVDCDGFFYRGKPVVVVGCESAAVSGALTLVLYAEKVHLVCEQLKVTDVLAEHLRESSVIVHEGRSLKAIEGKDAVERVSLDNGEVLDVEGVFIELGAKGAVELAATLGVVLDSETMQYVVTNKRQETNIAGVYAAGDICGPPWQIAKAVGEGCVAGLEAAAYARKIRTSTGQTAR